MPNASHPSTEPSLAALIGGIINDARDLLLQEFTMAKLEIQDELRKTKTAVVSLGIGIGISAVGGLLLILMLVHLLHALTALPLWGCYGIVGGILLLSGLVVLYTGKKTAEEIEVVPETVETLKENVKWIRERTTSNGV
ncbi:MAG TPA: phage holin family protein [Candidatus Binatia bacterium]|nr:phage holin family protein [Candidatus Binatia bacterium]